MKTPLTVMLTCANGQVGPAVIAMMRGHPDYEVRVVGVAAENQFAGYGHACCDAFHEVPFGDDLAYWDTLRNVIERERVQLIFIGSDEEALAITAHADELEGMACKAACSTYPVNVLSTNKYELIRHLRKADVPCTDALEARSIEDLPAVLTQIGYPDLDAVIKPKIGRGSRGFRIISKHSDPYAEFLTANRTNITIEELQRAFADQPESLKNYLFMRYLPGDKYSTDMLVCKGEVVCAVTRNNGPSPKISPPTQLADIVFDEDVYDYALSVVRATGHDYFVQVESGRDIDGSLKLIETNIRLDATLPITGGLGLNFYHEMMTYARTGLYRDGLPPFPRIPQRRRFYRYWQHNFLDLA